MYIGPFNIILSCSLAYQNPVNREYNTEKPFPNGINWTKKLTHIFQQSLCFFLFFSFKPYPPSESDPTINYVCGVERERGNTHTYTKKKNNYRKAYGFVCCQRNRQRYKWLWTSSNHNQIHTLVFSCMDERERNRKREENEISLCWFVGLLFALAHHLCLLV